MVLLVSYKRKGCLEQCEAVLSVERVVTQQTGSVLSIAVEMLWVDVVALVVVSNWRDIV